MATINITSDQLDRNKLEAIKAFLNELKIKFEISNDYDIPKEHKELVLDRIKKSNPKKLANWKDVKDSFDGI
jgi:alcohol dehydrogenase YqhD (iron-dependent ADH family)